MMRKAGPLDPYGYNRPRTRSGAFVAGYATWEQVQERMRSLGFWFSDIRRKWFHRGTGASVAEGCELDYLTERAMRRVP